MASVNKVILMGNCGKDPEVRTMADGKQVANVSIATSTRRKDKHSGETITTTEWHRVVFYDRLAEIVGQYVHKGEPLYVEGRLKYGKYNNKEGVEVQTADVVATEIQLLGQRPSAGNSGGNQGANGGTRAPAPSRPPAPAQNRADPAPNAGFDDMDDDIPF